MQRLVLRLDDDESDWTQLSGDGSSSAATFGLPGVHHHDEGNNAGPDHLLICIGPSVWPRPGHSMQSTLRAPGPLCPCQLLPSSALVLLVLITARAMLSCQRAADWPVRRSTPRWTPACRPLSRLPGSGITSACVKPSSQSNLAAGTCGTCLGCVPQAVSRTPCPLHSSRRSSARRRHNDNATRQLPAARLH